MAARKGIDVKKEESASDTLLKYGSFLFLIT